MKLATKSFSDVEITVAATVATNKEQIAERNVVCKACSHEFAVSEVIKHNTQEKRGYCHCPACQAINDIKKTLTCGYIAEREKKQSIEEVNNLLATVGRKELI